MPELPEVEFARRCWESWGSGRRVETVSATASRVLRPGTPRSLQTLKGARLTDFDRRGKNLLITARTGSGKRSPGVVGLWSHLGMTGKWVRRPADEAAPRFARATLRLDDGKALHYCDMRLFGRLRVVPGADWAEVPDLGALGPDPLADGIDRKRLAEKLAGTKLPVKVALLDQRLLAGVGNIQASEALHRAGIDPRRPGKSLGKAEVTRLATGITRSIEATIARFAGALTPEGDIRYVEEPGTPNPFRVYDRAGARCPRCKRGVLTRVIQAGRSTFYCPSCQR